MLIALLFAIYGQYFGVTIRITRVIDAMRLIVFLRANRQQNAHTTDINVRHRHQQNTLVASTIQKSSTLKK